MAKNQKNKAKGFGFSETKKIKVGQKKQLSEQQPLFLVTNDDELDSEVETQEQERWVQEQLSKNLSVDQFNAEFKVMGWLLKIDDASYSQQNQDGKLEEYSGKCFLLKNQAKPYVIEFAKYDENHPLIPRDIFVAIANWQVRMVVC